MNISSILLIGTGNPLSLHVIRALGSAFPGVPLHALSVRSDSQHISRYSRYLSSYSFLKSENEEELVEEILGKIRETDASVLLPVDEPNVLLLSRLRPQLEEHVHMPPLPQPDIYDSLVYKNRLHDLLKRYELPTAITYPVNEVDLATLRKNQFPFLLKPVRGSSGVGIMRINDSEGLNAGIKAINHDDYILQEYIPGVNIDCSLLAVDGEIKAFTIQKGIANIGFIFSTAIQFEMNDDLYALVRKLVETTSYSGIAHLDFRWDERDGQLKLIDFNARFWHSILGSRAVGVDFTLLYCYAAMGIPFDRPVFKEDTYMMGRSSIRHYRKLARSFFQKPASPATHTDLWDRIRDPLPEIIRYFADHSFKA